MTPADLDRVMEIAESLKDAPHWPRSAFLAALEPEGAPPRIALVLEYPFGAVQAAEKLNTEGDGGFNPRVRPIESTPALAAEGRFSLVSHEISSFSAASEALLSEPPQASGHDFQPVLRLSKDAVNASKSTWALHTAEKLEIKPALYQGTTSVVPQTHDNTGRALAPAGYSPPITPETPAFSAACGMGECVGIVGFLVASLLPPQAELETVAVASELQRRGMARQLFAALAAGLRAAQVEEIFLEARASNHPALALYRRLGFLESGRRIRYYQNPVEDAVLMRLRL
jgi:ribosomal-protein-alanine N-acetyltransferase